MGYYDLHVHTSYSRDGFCSVKEAVEAAKGAGLCGIAIADHNTTEGAAEGKRFSSGDFLVIPAIEVSSKHGHVIGLGVEKPVPAGLPAAETVELIKEQGGLAVAAHPFGLSPKPCLALHAKFDAIEVFSPRRYLGNHLARWYAERNRLRMVAGSDAHFADEVGLAGIRVGCGPKLDGVLEEIRRGEASVFGRLLPPHEHLREALHKLVRRCFG